MGSGSPAVEREGVQASFLLLFGNNMGRLGGDVARGFSLFCGKSRDIRGRHPRGFQVGKGREEAQGSEKGRGAR